ncbi:MAG: hypothetical protein SFV19_07165 [Rhodospirillaceae bacterium]|nr:hypothetical protein [Rhodospirillaceae bacterium]
MTRRALAAVIVWAAVSAAVSTRAEPPPTANANVVRWATGAIAYRVKSTGAINGYETWRLSVHPDGSRTMAATVQYAPRDIQRHVVHRVDAEWRALDTYALLWLDGHWRATTLALRQGAQLTITGQSSTGPAAQNQTVSDQIVMVPHVLAADSWRAMLVDKTKSGPQPVAAYNFNATGEGAAPALGKVMDYRMTYVGAEQITVPAGTYATDHYRIEDAVDIYVTGEDAILVKFIYPSIDREHLLIEHKKGP